MEFSVDEEFKLPRDHIDDLFMGMGVFWEESTLFDFPIDKGHIGRVVKVAVEAGKQLASFLFAEIVVRHREAWIFSLYYR